MFSAPIKSVNMKMNVLLVRICIMTLTMSNTYPLFRNDKGAHATQHSVLTEIPDWSYAGNVFHIYSLLL